MQRATLNLIYPDESNPREADDVRTHLLRLSLRKLGFIQPIFLNQDGLILSGHQRHSAALDIGYETAPVETVEISDKDRRGINVMFNRATNDFTAFQTGSSQRDSIEIADLMAMAEEMDDWEGEDFLAYNCAERSIVGMGDAIADKYNRKSLLIASSMRRKGVRIPIIVSESGEVLNGVHRLFEARHEGIDSWPVIEVPDDVASLTNSMLNYLSMDYSVDGEFAEMLRYSAYRRPQNNRGMLPKAYRFWANGNRTLPDADSYSTRYWRKFRDLHGTYVCDFGAGLCKVSPALAEKGIECVDFEPYRINPDSEIQKPDPVYSRQKAREFLQTIATADKPFGTVFLASVMNSIPFPRDRQCVLAIVHALCDIRTQVCGTCRDISDYEYEYSGIRNATYFKFDSEPGVRLGDALSNPKIQKFHTQEEFKQQAGFFWNKVETWKGGNVFYWRATAPKRKNPAVIRQALEFEFELPYADGHPMGMSEFAIECFSRRLGIEL